jgi:Na+/proline symporter
MDWLLVLASETLVLLMLSLCIASMSLTYLWSTSDKFKSLGTKNFEQLFVTARHAGNTWLLFWAMYSSIAGAWLIPTAGVIGYLNGLTGLLAFSLAVGGSCFLVTSVAILAYNHLPETCSLPQSLGLRYGRPLELYMLAVMLLASLLSLVKEYLVLMQVLVEVLGLDRRIVLGIATAVSICYICYGGALVGLFIDQIHGALGVAALLVVGYYVGTSAQDYSPPSRAMLLYGFDKTASNFNGLTALVIALTNQPFYEVRLTSGLATMTMMRYWIVHLQLLWPVAPGCHACTGQLVYICASRGQVERAQHCAGSDCTRLARSELWRKCVCSAYVPGRS